MLAHDQCPDAASRYLSGALCFGCWPENKAVLSKTFFKKCFETLSKIKYNSELQSNFG
jgi:hypothetical protein